MKSADELWREIDSAAVADGTVMLWWLYQAGVVCKTPGGVVAVVDPYLSDAVTRSYGSRRNVPAPLDPGQARVDALLASHSHEDHLDPDSITPFMSHDQARFIGPPMATDKVVAAGVPASRTTPVGRGGLIQLGDLAVRVVHARHDFAPEPTPDAVGYVLECGDVRVHHSGDTEYDCEIVSDTRDVSASMICINGTAGNMNAHEAALLAWQQRTRLAIPFHYGLWQDADYGEGAILDPQVFVDTYHRLDPAGPTLLFEVSAPVVIGPGGLVA